MVHRREETGVEFKTFDPAHHSGSVRGWLHQPHVARWWGDAREALDHVAQSAPDAHAVIVADGTPVGYLCWQKPPLRELEEVGLTDLPDGLVDIDILIGEPDRLGQGIGSEALRLLLARLRRSSVPFAGLGTSVSNVRALRAFQGAGFRPFRDFHDPQWGPCRYLVARL